MQITWNDADKILRLINTCEDTCKSAQDARQLGVRILDAFPTLEPLFPDLRAKASARCDG